MTRLPHVFVLAVQFLLAGLSGLHAESLATAFSIWQGDVQRIGHLGDAQKDFNLVGHIEPWPEITKLDWKLNSGGAKWMSFRTFRRLVADGDFNADIPISLMIPGTNRVLLSPVSGWTNAGTYGSGGKNNWFASVALPHPMA